MKTLFNRLAIKRWRQNGLIDEVDGKMYRTINDVRYEVVLTESKKYQLVPVESASQEKDVRKPRKGNNRKEDSESTEE